MKQKLFFLADNRNQRRRRWSKEREREKAVACWLLLLFILWQTDNKKRKKKKKEEELLRARELNKQSLIFQGILYDNGAGRDALSCYNTARFRGCHGGIISPRCWPALRDATLLSLLLIFNGHLMMIFEVFAGSSRGIVWLSFCIEATTNKQRLSRVIFTFLCDCLYILVRCCN